MKFGVIGTGMMGCEHIRNLAHIPDVDLIAVSDPDPTSRQWASKACGETFAPVVCADYQQLLDLHSVHPCDSHSDRQMPSHAQVWRQ